MSIKNVRVEATDIRAEACAWMSQLETGDMKPADVDAFREWMQRSPRHHYEMRRLARLSTSLNVLTEMIEPLQDAARQRREAVAPKNRGGWRKPVSWALASSLAVIVVIFTLDQQPTQPEDTGQWPLLISTEVGEYREEFLPDGSSIALNTDSRVEVFYTNESREVRLSKGEVLFTVAPDTSRPFSVLAGKRLVQAVGTAFLVRHDAESFELMVTEGKVRLQELQATLAPESASSKDRPQTETQNTRVINTRIGLASEGILVKAGQRFAQSSDAAESALDAPVLETVSSDELRRKLAWQDGLLEFSDTELGQVVLEVSRHTSLRIEIPDPTLRELRFGGVFRTGDTASLFKALEAAFDVQATYINEDTIQLTRSGG